VACRGFDKAADARDELFLRERYGWRLDAAAIRG